VADIGLLLQRHRNIITQLKGSRELGAHLGDVRFSFYNCRNSASQRTAASGHERSPGVL